MLQLGAVAMTVVLAGLRFGIVGPTASALPPDKALPLLIAVAFLCVVGLTRRDHRSVAWLATIGAASVVTIDLATLLRQLVEGFGIEPGDPGWES